MPLTVLGFEAFAVSSRWYPGLLEDLQEDTETGQVSGIAANGRWFIEVQSSEAPAEAISWLAVSVTSTSGFSEIVGRSLPLVVPLLLNRTDEFLS